MCGLGWELDKKEGEHNHFIFGWLVYIMFTSFLLTIWWLVANQQAH
jgi:hypothetical protein